MILSRKPVPTFRDHALFCFAHDLFRKPVPTFRDHALFCLRMILSRKPVPTFRDHALAIAAVLSLATPLQARSADAGRSPIIGLELRHPATYQSPRGTLQDVVPIPPAPPPRSNAARPPPPIYVPRTGQLLPNLPTVSPSGRRGRETYQDRAARCAHQAGIYGVRAGRRSAYIAACANQ